MTIDIEFTLGARPVEGGPIGFGSETAYMGEPVNVLLSKAPHILIGGMTGAGKSVLLHDLICQAITGHTPAQVGLLLIDPKRVEMGIYRGLPHLLLEPVYTGDHIAYALDAAVAEMHSRFAIMERNGARDIYEAPWPRVMVVVDELANLMLGGKRFVRPIIEIASMGRAAGVHLILATQRPDAKVIDGLIRANVPTRVSLPTITANDSRIILDEAGAETLETPGRLVRLPGQRDAIFALGRFWRSSDIEATLSPWKKTGVWHG